MNTRIFRRGFTVIELLVVIAIISILTAVIYANFNDARIDARNKAFQSEMKELQLAIEVYYAQNRQYPAALTDLVPDFIPELPNPADSANTACALTYQEDSPAYYKVIAANCIGGASTASEGIQPTDEMARCADWCPASGACDPSTAAFYESVAVYTAGSECL